MGRLADELKKRFKRPQDALRALGLPEDLLSPARLAKDGALKGMRPSDAGRMDKGFHDRADRAMEMGEEDGMMLDGEEDRDEFDDESDRDEDNERAQRRWLLHRFGDACMRNGMSLDEVRAMLEDMDMPENALEGGMGGALAEDVEHALRKLGRDWSERDLEGVGGTGTSEYRKMPQSRDKRRRMAKDAQLANKQLGLDRLTPKRGDFCNYGDQPVLAYDQQQSDGDDDRFEAWFGASRIKTNAI